MLPKQELRILVSGTASDSHTWNLVFLQLFLEEQGHPVTNLGPCVTADLLASHCREELPDLVVLSSVNGHGYRDGLTAVARLRAEPALDSATIVIGGKLGVAGSRDPEAAALLRAAGCHAVYDDGDLNALRDLVAELAAARAGRVSA